MKAMTRTTRIAIVATLFLIAYMFVLWLLFWPVPGANRPPLRQYTPQERKAIKARLVYHGLQHEVSIIYGWPDNPYFIRNGRRCKF